MVRSIFTIRFIIPHNSSCVKQLRESFSWISPPPPPAASGRVERWSRPGRRCRTSAGSAYLKDTEENVFGVMRDDPAAKQAPSQPAPSKNARTGSETTRGASTSSSAPGRIPKSWTPRLRATDAFRRPGDALSAARPGRTPPEGMTSGRTGNASCRTRQPWRQSRGERRSPCVFPSRGTGLLSLHRPRRKTVFTKGAAPLPFQAQDFRVIQSGSCRIRKHLLS